MSVRFVFVAYNLSAKIQILKMIIRYPYDTLQLLRNVSIVPWKTMPSIPAFLDPMGLR